MTGSTGGDAETGASETGDGNGDGDGDGNGDGDGDQPVARTLVKVRHLTSGAPTEPNPHDQVEIVAVDFDAPEPTPMHVTELGPGSRIGYAQWFEGHGQVFQAGESDAPAPAKLVRFENGEYIATAITPASTIGRVRWLALRSDGSGALVKLSSSFSWLLPDPDWPDDCALVWVEYDAAREPLAAHALEPDLPNCVQDDALPAIGLDAAGELAAWLVAVGDEIQLRAVEIDGVPGPVQTLAVAPKMTDYGLFVDAHKLSATLDLDGNGEAELVVYDRTQLDAPPTTYPFEGPSDSASWSKDGDWVVWRRSPAMDVMFMAFDGLVPSTPVALVGPEVAAGFGEQITDEGAVRFVYSAPGVEPLEATGLAEVEIGPDGPGLATPITAAVADDEQVGLVTHHEGSLASAYEIQSVPPDEGTSAFAVVDSGASPFDQRVFEVAADSNAYVSWAPGETRRLLVIELQPHYRISLVDLDTPEPWGELVAEGSVGPLTIRDAGWSASGEHVLVHVRDEQTEPIGMAPEALARVPVSGGEPEIVLSIEGAQIDGWWTYESGR